MHAQYVHFPYLLEGQMKYVASCRQRRYGWGQADIKRPVEDFRTVSRGGAELAH